MRSLILLLAFLPSLVLATEPRAQHCKWLRERYTELYRQQQRGDQSDQLRREMARFHSDYFREKCQGSILL